MSKQLRIFGREVSGRLLQIVLGTATILILIPLVMAALQGNINTMMLYGAMATAIAFLFYVVSRRLQIKGILDEDLVLAVTHMYCYSTANPEPKNIINVVASTIDYGYYQSLFRRILNMATKFGYGIARSLSITSEGEKEPLKGLLRRLIEIFSARDVSRYMRAEHTTMLDEFERDYMRRIEALKMIQSAYITILTSSVFILATAALMSLFYESEMMIIFLFAGSILGLIAITLAIRGLLPRETFLWIDRDNPPRDYRIYRTLFGVTPFIAISLGMVGYVLYSYTGAMIAAGMGLLPPGIVAFMIERRVRDVDEHYPVFIKTVGENFTMNPNMIKTLSLLSDLELGRLKEAIIRLKRRLKSGIDTMMSINLFASELSSNLVHKFTRIFFDSIAAGGNPIESSEVIGVTISRINHLRKNRMSVSGGFTTMIIIIQPIVISLLVIILGIISMFNDYMISLPYFALYPIPVETFTIGAAAFAITSSAINAVIMYTTRGGVRGTVFLFYGLMLILSAAGWLAGEYIVNSIMQPLSVPLPGS